MIHMKPRVYCIFGHDNDSYLFEGRDVKRCNLCGSITDRRCSLDGFKVQKRKYDLSTTYDGAFIGSQRFKDVYDKNEMRGLNFLKLPSDPDFYLVTIAEMVEFDSLRRETRFENPCKECCQYESVIGATPIFLKNKSIVREGNFYRTDLEFGSDDEKAPLIIISRESADILKKANLNGIDYNPVE